MSVYREKPTRNTGDGISFLLFPSVRAVFGRFLPEPPPGESLSFFLPPLAFRINYIRLDIFCFYCLFPVCIY
ncbi:hypothetical protein TSAR_012257 [Trichomalopsis sarcophagae]|uniref:Uncharacterized protein n=1 Tax=Trichomalopsis sarcophagae TaxID=543379 RepID=A0A232F9N7_9HYME|nr:hypothetical protein TSAR_012257 [Trichomalopsis sarcophagae]